MIEQIYNAIRDEFDNDLTRGPPSPLWPHLDAETRMRYVRAVGSIVAKAKAAIERNHELTDNAADDKNTIKRLRKMLAEVEAKVSP